MKIRTQLILASFFLAVVPLVAIVTYSYHSSRTALEAAYQREANRATRQMDRRLASIRNDLEQRLALVSTLPLKDSKQTTGTAQQPFVGNIVTAMGEAAGFVDALEFQPVAPVAPAPAVASSRRIVVREGAPRPPAAPAVPLLPRETAALLAGDPDDPDPDVDLDVDLPDFDVEPMIIDLPEPPEIPPYFLSKEQQELIGKLASLGARLGSAHNLSAEERKSLQDQIHAAEREMNRVSAARDREYSLSVDAAHREYSKDVGALQEEAAARRERLQREREDRARRRAERQATNRANTVPKAAATPTVAATAPVPTAAAATTPAKPKPAKQPAQVRIRTLTEAEKAKVRESVKKTSLILGRHFNAPVKKEGEVVGQITAQVSPQEVIRRVLGSGDDDRSEVPFAIDREGTVYARNQDERARLEALGISKRVQNASTVKDIDGWIVNTSTDPQSGLKIGVARQVGDNFAELRATAGRNFGLGLGLIALALMGIVPLASHLTRDVKAVSAGAERIAQGDLMTRLPVRSRNEFGQLALAFNRMAEDLSIHQQKLLEQERARKEQELQQKLLAVEYERKTVELEDARRFQLSMLPKEVPRHGAYDVAVFTRTATEVGGDYYDFHSAGDVLSVTIGDATGHGAKAGTMVTVIKTLFAGYNAHTEPSDFLRDAAEKIKRMELGRMSMALSLARLDGKRLTLTSAGMPPVLLHRAATRQVEELSIGSTPLGTLGTEYEQLTADIAPGDTILFMTDGFPELMNDAGEQLGYVAALEAFASIAAAPDADRVIARLASFAEQWHGDTAPNDDVTFVVVRVVA